MVAGERDRPDVAHRRAQWTKYQDRVEPERLVFIDETWTKTNMAPLRGWAPWGQRLTAKVPHGHWQTTTFLAALRAYPTLGNAGNLRGWLLTIAHRKAIDHHRANGRRPVPVAELADIPVEDPGPADDGVWELVGALPPKQRTAVALRYACDLPHAEIAAALGCSPAAARRSLHEGMKRLRNDLGARESGPGREGT